MAAFENFSGRSILIEKSFGTCWGWHQFEIDVSDAGEGAEGTGEEFGEVEPGYVFYHHATGLDGAACERCEVHADDEVSDCAEEAAAVTGRVSGEDAADRGVLAKGWLDREELLFSGKDCGEV